MGNRVLFASSSHFYLRLPWVALCIRPDFSLVYYREIPGTTDKILNSHCVFCHSDLDLICDLCDCDLGRVKGCTTGAIVYVDTGVGMGAKRKNLAVGESLKCAGTQTNVTHPAARANSVTGVSLPVARRLLSIQEQFPVPARTILRLCYCSPTRCAYSWQSCATRSGWVVSVIQLFLHSKHYASLRAS